MLAEWDATQRRRPRRVSLACTHITFWFYMYRFTLITGKLRELQSSAQSLLVHGGRCLCFMVPTVPTHSPQSAAVAPAGPHQTRAKKA